MNADPSNPGCKNYSNISVQITLFILVDLGDTYDEVSSNTNEC